MIYIGCAKKRTLADLPFSYYLLTICLFLFFSPLSWAQQGANPEKKIADTSIEELLQKFIQNGSNQLYDGTFVYFYEDQVQAVKVRRSVNDQGVVVEKFLPQDDEQKNNSRLLSNQFCLLDNGWQYRFKAIASSFPFTVNNTFKELQKNYKFSITGSKTVADNNAIGITIEAKDPLRYGYQLWFEPKTATLLKYKLVDQKGKAVEQYFFTDISIRRRQEQQDTSGVYKKSLQSAVPCKQRFSGLSDAFKQFFINESIPEGFQAISYRHGLIKETERHARQFQLSDGLSSVSIFIEDRGDVNRKIKGVIKIGPLSVAGKTIGNHQITVIGAIPVDSALQFVNSIRP